MAPSRISNGDSDASSGGDVAMNDVAGPIARVKRDNGDFLMPVRALPAANPPAAAVQKRVSWQVEPQANLSNLQDALDTPDYTVLSNFKAENTSSDNGAQDSDTNPNTTASSVAGDVQHMDGRKRRSEAFQLRKSVFGKKHSRLNEYKVCLPIPSRLVPYN